MMQQVSRISDPSWVAVAAREFSDHWHRLGFQSLSEVACELGESYRTVRKLDYRCPDPTLRMDTCLRLFNGLWTLALSQSPGLAAEEERLFAASLGRIARTLPLSQKLDRERRTAIERYSASGHG